VVLTLLSSDGTRSAAVACATLLANFHDLKAVIMVGIAGGVPAPGNPVLHVRLGDIVVATEIIDYGHLRSVDGRQQLRRRLDSPSIDLIGADRILNAGEARGDRPWETWLDDVPQTFAQPPVDSDILLIGGEEMAHPDDSGFGRRRGFPRVHRGVVASGDQLVRDAAQRDRLAGQYGAYAIEMEGAGIAVGSMHRSVPWFMVRGIADYCDNKTKNDQWHPYASLAAAAYVRALLVHCTPKNVMLPATREPQRMRAQVLPSRPNGRINSLKVIVDALLAISQINDSETRRILVAMLPHNIRTQVPYQAVPRLQVIAMVTTCAGFPHGAQALVQALESCLPTDSPAVEIARAVIIEHWPGLIE